MCLKSYMGSFLLQFWFFFPRLSAFIFQDKSRERDLTLIVLASLDKFGWSLNDHVYLVVPPLLSQFESYQCPTPLKLCFLSTFRRLVLSCDLSLMMGRLVHPLVRYISDTSHPLEVKYSVIDTLKVLHEAYPLDIEPFIPCIR